MKEPMFGGNLSVLELEMEMDKQANTANANANSSSSSSIVASTNSTIIEYHI